MKFEKILEYVKKNNIDGVKLYLTGHFSVSYNNSYLFHAACAKEHIEIINLFLNYPKLKFLENYNNSLVIAAYNSNYQAVKLLLKDDRFDPSFENNQALMDAFSNDDKKMVKLLLKDSRVNPTDQYHFSLFYSLKFKLFDLLELLLNHKSFSFIPYKIEDFKNNFKLIDSLIKLYEIPILKDDLLIFFEKEKDLVNNIKIKTTMNNF